MCYEERVEIVKAIKYVDMVVPQENRNKVEALEKYNFQKMFVGDDWKGSPLFTELEHKCSKAEAERDTYKMIYENLLNKVIK